MNVKQQSVSPLAFKFLIGLAVVSVMGFAVMNDSHPHPRVQIDPEPQISETVSSTHQINFTAEFDKGTIIIKNDNDFDWINTKISFTSGPLNQYSLIVGTINAGETKSYPISKFMNINGEGFNRLKYIPKQVLVYTDDASGGKQYPQEYLLQNAQLTVHNFLEQSL